MTVSDDLPTPPLPLATAITRVRGSSAIDFSGLPPRSFVVSTAFSSGLITSNRSSTRSTFGERADVLRDLVLEGAAQRTAGDGERDRDRDGIAVDQDVANHVELGDRLPQLRIDHALERAQDLVAVR